jgi:hypothetical protein
MIPVRTTQWFRNYLIDNAQLDQIFAREPQSPRGFVSMP